MSTISTGGGASSDVPNQICQRSNEIWPDAQDLLNFIEGAVNTVGGWIMDGFSFLNSIFGAFDIFDVKSKIEQAINDFQSFMQALKEMVDKIQEILHGIFMPWIMPQYGDKWATIADHMWNVSSLLQPEGVRAPGSPQWRGEAAESYRMLVDKYKSAAEFASDIAIQHSDRLHESAVQAQELYIAILGLIIAIILTIVAAGIEAGTIVGIPVAIATLIKEGADLVGSIIDTIIELVTFIADQVQAFIGIVAALQAAEFHFPGGAWPKPGG